MKDGESEGGAGEATSADSAAVPRPEGSADGRGTAPPPSGLARLIQTLRRTPTRPAPEDGPTSPLALPRTPEVEPAPAPPEGDRTPDPPEATAPPAPPTPPRVGSRPTPIRDRFITRVARYLRGGKGERDQLAGGILLDADSLLRAGESHSVAEAATILAREGVKDEGARLLARELLDENLIEYLTARLGWERTPEARAPLLTLAALVPERLAPKLAEALAEAPDRGVRRALMDALGRLGAPGREAAHRLIADGRWFAVRNGVVLLAEIGDPEAAEAIRGTLAHPDPRVRREGVMALARIGDASAWSALAGMFSDPAPEVRAAAAMGVGALGTGEAVPTLLGHLEGEGEEEVLIHLLRTLGRLGDPTALPAIARRAEGGRFSRPSRPVRVAAYQALALIGTPEARRLLEVGAGDRDPELQRAVRGILRRGARSHQGGERNQMDVSDSDRGKDVSEPEN